MKNVAKAIATGVLIALAIIVVTGCITTVDTKTLPDGTIVTVSTRKTDIASLASAAEVAEKLTPTIERLATIYKANMASKSPAVEEPAYTPPK